MEHLTTKLPELIDDTFLERNGFNSDMQSSCTVVPTGGGHMAYQRFFLRFNNQRPSLFVKAHDTSLFTDPERASHSQAYLLKEAMVYQYLSQNGYAYIPSYTTMLPEGHLAMEELAQEDDWFWRAPKDSRAVQQYITDTFQALEALQSIPLPAFTQYESDYFFPKRIMKVYMEEGWKHLNQCNKERAKARLITWREQLHEGFKEYADQLYYNLDSLVEEGKALYDQPQQMYFAHHDARQANIGWHPNKGSRLVDWSWADVGFKNADATMFIIDMTKSGHFIEPTNLKTYFNRDHALLLIGNWLGRSIEPTRDGDPTVRFHQLASAVTAYKLLKEL